MSNFMHDYVLTIFHTFNMEPGIYTADVFNTAVLDLPFGELHVIDTKATEFPRLGEDIKLNDHIQKTFMKAIGPGALADMVQLVRIHGSKLRDMDRWDEWNTLVSFALTKQLKPVIVFKNAPDSQGYYVADVRMMVLHAGKFDLS